MDIQSALAPLRKEIIEPSLALFSLLGALLVVAWLCVASFVPFFLLIDWLTGRPSQDFRWLLPHTDWISLLVGAGVGHLGGRIVERHEAAKRLTGRSQAKNSLE